MSFPNGPDTNFHLSQLNIPAQGINNSQVLNGYVDLTTNQGVISGAKTFASKVVFLSGASFGLGNVSGPTFGQTTLSAGSGTAMTGAAANGSIIMMSRHNVTGGLAAPAALSVGSISPGSGFTIRSTSNADASIVNWWIVNP